MCTYKLCNASIIIRESSIAKTSPIKSDRSHKFQNSAKISLDVYSCFDSTMWIRFLLCDHFCLSFPNSALGTFPLN
jgi:hypothetical protein